MRVKHISALPRISPGIWRQLAAENLAGKELPVSWSALLITPDAVCEPHDSQGSETPNQERHDSDRVSLIQRVKRHCTLQRRLYGFLKSSLDDCDLVLLRYRAHDLQLLRFIKHCPVPVFTVHHTFEVDELRGSGTIGLLRSFFERWIGPRVLKHVSGIIAVTEEVGRYEQLRTKEHRPPSFIYPNGSTCRELPPNDRRGNTVELLFVASHFFPWHGLDLLLRSMQDDDVSFVLHLVGQVSAADKDLAVRDDRVRIHGHLPPDEIRRLSERCWMGLSSLALDRKGMQEASPLKVREYLSLGLPVYGAHRETFPETFPFYTQGLPDITEIVRVARSHRAVTRAHVNVEARPLIDKSRLLNDLYRQLASYHDP